MKWKSMYIYQSIWWIHTGDPTQYSITPNRNTANSMQSLLAHTYTHTHTLWAMLVPWQYSTLSRCTHACTYSLTRLFRWLDTLADMHAQKHKFLSHTCTHSGIRADLRAAGMLISQSSHRIVFFNVFLLTGQILARHSGDLWLTLSPQQGQNARRGPVFLTSDRKHSLETLHGYTAAGICSSAGCKFKVNCGVW